MSDCPIHGPNAIGVCPECVGAEVRSDRFRRSAALDERDRIGARYLREAAHALQPHGGSVATALQRLADKLDGGGS